MRVSLNPIIILIACISIFLGCSTVDKRTFFRAESTGGGISKEEYRLDIRELGCPLIAIPNTQDRDLFKTTLKHGTDEFKISLSFRPKNEFESYWWGPLWLPIVPIYLFKNKNELTQEAVVFISFDKKEWKTHYDPDDKSTWPARKEESAAAILPKVNKVLAVYQDEQNKAITVSGVRAQEGPWSQSKFRAEYRLVLQNSFSEKIRAVISIEDQDFEFTLIKKQSWTAQFYLLGCVQ